MHRTTMTGIHEFKLGDWQVYPLQNRLCRGAYTVRIQHLSMQVLLFLAAQPGLVATYDELLVSLWPGRIAGEDAVHRRIADLRRHLKDNARAPSYIETIPKRGYRLVSPVEPRPVRQQNETTTGPLQTWDRAPFPAG